MKLYRLIRNDEARWDENRAYVIRAKDEADARQIASLAHADEGSEIWLDPERTTLIELTNNGNAGIILLDFRAG